MASKKNTTKTNETNVTNENTKTNETNVTNENTKANATNVTNENTNTERTLIMSESISNIISTIEAEIKPENYIYTTTTATGAIVEAKRITRKLYGKIDGKTEITFSGAVVDDIQELDRLLAIEKESKFQLSQAIYQISEKESYKSYKIKNITEFCSKIFDMKSGNTSIYLRIGKYFMRNGKLIDELKGFKFSAVAECLKLVSQERQAEYIEDNKLEVNTLSGENLDNFVHAMLSPIITQALPINETMTKDDIRKKIDEYLPEVELTEEQKAKKEKRDKAKKDKKAAEKFYTDYKDRIQNIATINILVQNLTEQILEYMDKVNNDIDASISEELIHYIENVQKSTIDIEKNLVISEVTDSDTDK